MEVGQSGCWTVVVVVDSHGYFAGWIKMRYLYSYIIFIIICIIARTKYANPQTSSVGTKKNSCKSVTWLAVPYAPILVF